MTTETTETTTPKAPKNKGANGTAMPTVSPEDNIKLALALFDSIPDDEKPAALRQAQLVIVGKKAYALVAKAYFEVTGEKLGTDIALDSDGFFIDDAGNGNCDEDEEEDEDDDDAVDATAGEGDDEGETDDDDINPAAAIKLLRKWMKDGEYTQAYVARKLRVTQPAVNNWLQRGGFPRPKLVPRILKLCES